MIPSTKAAVAAKAWSCMAGEASSSGAKVKAFPQLREFLVGKHTTTATTRMLGGQKISEAVKIQAFLAQA
jgi:hypothetical protein